MNRIESDGTLAQKPPLPRSFYLPSAAVVAPLLLGHWLLRRTATGLRGGVIVETEAYTTHDAACHAANGETKRNRVMWGPPGHGYVYLIYGYHFCVNAVCRPHGIPEAVLIRALEPVAGLRLMKEARPVKLDRELTSGPAKLCEALQIDRNLDGVDLCAPESPLWIARNPGAESLRKSQGPVVATTRVGITKAMELPFRFYLEKNPFVSKRSAAGGRVDGSLFKAAAGRGGP